MKDTNTSIASYSSAVTIKAPFKDILFVNQGTSIVNISGLLLAPSESYSDSSGDSLEQNFTSYDINFQAGGINNLVVITKIYS